MAKVPLNNIKERIKKNASLSGEELDSKINEKMEELAGLVTEEGAAHIVANELGVEIFSEEPQELKIDNIKPFMRNLKVTCKVVRVFETVNFEKNSSPGKVKSCIAGDETGKTRISFWHEAADKIENIKEGDVLQLEKVSSKENNGRTELNVSFSDAITINPEGIDIQVSDTETEPEIKKIVELGKEGPASILGIIVQAFSPYYYPLCPSCGKKIKDGKCEVHGEVESKDGCVLNFIIDDGSDTIRCVLFNNTVEEMLETTIEDLKKNNSEDNMVKSKLIGKPVKIYGFIKINSYTSRKDLIVRKAYKNVKPSEEAEKYSE
ncbi:MAG: hypothetical protein ACQESP_12260 [Candidatus Muiribacteriota bacterium]